MPSALELPDSSYTYNLADQTNFLLVLLALNSVISPFMNSMRLHQNALMGSYLTGVRAEHYNKAHRTNANNHAQCNFFTLLLKTKSVLYIHRCPLAGPLLLALFYKLVSPCPRFEDISLIDVYSRSGNRPHFHNGRTKVRAQLALLRLGTLP